MYEASYRVDAENLNPERARARAVELRHQDALPLAEHHFPAADLQGEVVTEQHRAQVRVRVHAVAVGMIRIVVHPLGVARHHLFEEALHVGEQRRLELVDEERAGGVHRPEADEPLADVEPTHELHDAIGEIDELDPLVGLHDDRLAVNRKAADSRRSHFLDGLLANGDSRTLAHALLVGFWDVPVRTGYVTK